LESKSIPQQRTPQIIDEALSMMPKELNNMILGYHRGTIIDRIANKQIDIYNKEQVLEVAREFFQDYRKEQFPSIDLSNKSLINLDEVIKFITKFNEEKLVVRTLKANDLDVIMNIMGFSTRYSLDDRRLKKAQKLINVDINMYNDLNRKYLKSLKDLASNQVIEHRLQLHNTVTVLLLLVGTIVEESSINHKFKYNHFANYLGDYFFINGILRQTDYYSGTFLFVRQDPVNINVSKFSLSYSEIKNYRMIIDLFDIFGCVLGSVLSDDESESLKIKGENRFLPSYCIGYWPYLHDAIFDRFRIYSNNSRIKISNINLKDVVRKYGNEMLFKVLSNLEQFLKLEITMKHDHSEAHQQMLDQIHETLNRLL